MVFLHVKRDAEVQFYMEAPAASPVAQVASRAAEMHNLIRRIHRICHHGAAYAEQAMQDEAAPEGGESPDGAAAAAGMASMALDAGPSADSSAAAAATLPASAVPNLQPDGLVQATMMTVEAPVPAVSADMSPSAATDIETAASATSGMASGPTAASPERDASADAASAAASEPQQPDASIAEPQTPIEQLCRTLLAATQLIDKERATQRQLLTMGELHAAIDAIRSAADGVIFSGQQLDSKFTGELEASSPPDEGMGADIPPEVAVLWLANRRLDNGKTLAAEVGRNEKTKVVVSVQRDKEPAPPKSTEPPDEEYKHMLAWYYKRQEDNKRLEEDMDLGYYNSPWADPGSMKQKLTGMRGVQMPYAPRPAFS